MALLAAVDPEEVLKLLREVAIAIDALVRWHRLTRESALLVGS